MMGASHAATGICVGLATLPVAPAHGPVASGLWVAVVGGFALAPDLDSGGSSAARMWGPVSRVAGSLIGRAAGGHRGATHDVVLAPVLTAALVWACSLAWWPSLAVVAVAAGLAQVALDPVLPGRQTRSVVNVVGATAAVWWAATYRPDLAWLPLAAALGVAVHIAGDALTTSGVPVPFTGWQDHPPTWGARLFKTGTLPETAVVALTWAATAVLVIHRGGLAAHLTGA